MLPPADEVKTIFRGLVPTEGDSKILVGITMIFCLFGVAGLLPSLGSLLELHPHGVARGQFWRLGTGPLVAWTPQMAFFDATAVVVAAGLLCHWGRARLALWAIGLGAAVTAGTALFVVEGAYRGASGIASALFVVAAVEAWRRGEPAGRLVSLIALGGLAAKLLFEVSTAGTVAAGNLPVGVSVTPMVHAAGAAAGACIAARAVRFYPDRGGGRPRC